MATAGWPHAEREQRRTGLTPWDGSPSGWSARADLLLSHLVSPTLPDVSASTLGPGRAPSSARRRRDRHGRGLRGPLVPPTVDVGGRTVKVPAAQTRGERFDDLVLDAVESLEERWATELEKVEFAVEDVPPLEPGDPGTWAYDADVVADETAGGAVPLGRLLPAGRDGQGRPTSPRVVVYRRPLEARASDRLDLADLVHEVVVDQVARLLGLDPDDIDGSDD